MRCFHVDNVTIKHWWFRYQCLRCGRKSRNIPQNSFLETNIFENEKAN